MVNKETLKQAARTADRAVERALRKYRDGFVTDEEEITGVLLGNLDAELDGVIGGLTWSTSILRHRQGIAAEESRVGADMVIHVRMESENLAYSKGALVQAKRSEPGRPMSAARHDEFIKQCDKMLAISAASYVFNYAKSGMRCESAVVAKGLKGEQFHRNFQLTSYRFFLELFRCSFGHSRLTSALVSELPVPYLVEITAREA